MRGIVCIAALAAHILAVPAYSQDEDAYGIGNDTCATYSEIAEAALSDPEQNRRVLAHYVWVQGYMSGLFKLSAVYVNPAGAGPSEFPEDAMNLQEQLAILYGYCTLAPDNHVYDAAERLYKMMLDVQASGLSFEEFRRRENNGGN